MHYNWHWFSHWSTGALGNIAWRFRRTVDFEPAQQRLVGDRATEAFWGRQYRKGWEPKV